MSLRYELPTLAADQPPAFPSARACRDWLAVQPLANPVQAQTILLRQLNLLNRYELPAAERLKILELLRDPIVYAQDQTTRKFAGRPLPLTQSEQAGLAANRQLWQALLIGYIHCLDACSAGERELAHHGALIVERAIAALRAQLLDYYRAPSDPPEHLWKILHALYSSAEELGAAKTEIEDTLRSSSRTTSPSASYAHTLLIQHASPYELSPRQLQQVDIWMQRWANKVDVLSEAPASPKVPALVVDLDGARPAATSAGGMERPRWLELSALASSVKNRVARLKAGESPEALKLGRHFPAAACEVLLKHLYFHWCKGPTARIHVRQPANAACRLVGGFDAIHYYVSGKIFRQPGEGETLSRRQIEEIATLGRVATRHEDDYSREQGFTVEEWSVLDESPTGLRLMRPLPQAGVRVGSGQLLALKLEDAQHFLLAVARWARITVGNELHAGVNILPGTPLPIAVKGTGLQSLNEKHRQAFVLPAVAALNEPETLILPAGWFRPGRILDVFVDASFQVRLARLLERGSDFERVAFDRA